MIEVRHLCKSYGNHLAVKDLSFTLEPGKVYGLLGANGAGKSTTMNILTGYIGADSGDVFIKGYDLYKDPEKAKRHIGYLPEVPPLYQDMTIREYLRTVAELKGISSAERRSEISRVMEDCQLGERADTLIRHLSKGFRQRVGIAQALVGDPEIIILDEPAAGLDPFQIQEFRRLVETLGKTHTVVLSSHILSEVSAVCDELLVLRKGEIAARGSGAELARLVRGERQMELLAEGGRETILEILRTVPCILSWDMEEEHTDDSSGIEKSCFRVCLHIEPEADIRRDLFLAFCDRRIPLLEMSPAVRTLEEVFLELSDADQSVRRETNHEGSAPLNSPETMGRKEKKV